MTRSIVVASGTDIKLPAWGRSFWQDPNDGQLFLAYVSGNTQANFVTSSDSGVTWADPQFLFNVDDFAAHKNFDIVMDTDGHIHCGFRSINKAKYKFMGKVAGSGWTSASGNGAVGFPGQMSSSGHIALHWSPGPVGTNDVNPAPAPFPILRFTYKNSINHVSSVFFPYPYDGSLTGGAGDWMSDSFSPVYPKPGANGGFFIWNKTHSSFPSEENMSLTYVTDSGSIVLTARTLGFWELEDEIRIGAGLEGTVKLNESLTYASGATKDGIGNNWAILAASNVGIDMYCVGSEPLGGVGASGSFIKRVNTVYTGTNGTRSRAPNGFPINSISSGIRGASSSGAIKMDISWANEPGVRHLYVNDVNGVGVQRISRLKVGVTAATTTPADFTGWTFSDLEHSESGQIQEALATREYTGYNEDEPHFAYWNRFKALRHPVNQSIGSFKQEIVATVGNSIRPSGTAYLVVHDFAKTVRVTSPSVLPTFEFDIMSTPSGSNPLFVGVAASNIVADIEDIFDRNVVTGATLADNDFLVVELARPTLITRIEMLLYQIFDTVDSIQILASLDNEDFRVVHTTSDGLGWIRSLVKLTSDRSVSPLNIDTQNTEIMDAFVAKFIKIQFTTSATGKELRELRIYSPDTTVGEIRTGAEAGLGPTESQFFLSRSTAVRTEYFNSTQEGEIPNGWRTSGDWDWFVRASGELSKTNSLAPVAPQDGYQHGGVFHGETNGYNDGFVIRTVESGYSDPGFINPSISNTKTVGAPIGTSGILEVDVNVALNELTSNSVAGRDISFYVRYDMLGSGPMTGPEDDEFIISYTQDNIETTIDSYWTQAPCYLGKCDWYKVEYTVPTGISTLRWMYRRGTVAPPSLNVGERGIVWIDKITGLDSSPRNTIAGYIVGSNDFFTTGPSGGINGWMSKSDWTYINAYTFGYQWYKTRNGYMLGGPSAEAAIPAYLLGPSEGRIDAYLLGGEGVVSFPTGTINSYVGVRPGVSSDMPAFLLAGNTDANGAIDAWVGGVVASGFPVSSINAALIGTPTTSGNINGFLNGGFASGTVNAYVMGPPGVTTSVYSYLKTQDNISSIYSYMNTLADVTGVINCYLKTADGQSEVQAYMLVNEGGPRGYIKGSINGQYIDGYMMVNGAKDNILSYVSAKGAREIQGFLTGSEFASGSINSYMQVLASSEINGYIMGISGFPSGGINSFMVGVEAPQGLIDGYMVSMLDDICESHGTASLPSLPSYTLPLPSNIINHVAIVQPTSPETILGDKLVSWYDASTTKHIVLDGSGVLQLTDITGNGNHLVAPSGRPNYDTSSFRLGVCDFNGTVEPVGSRPVLVSSGVPFTDRLNPVYVWLTMYPRSYGVIVAPRAFGFYNNAFTQYMNVGVRTAGNTAANYVGATSSILNIGSAAPLDGTMRIWRLWGDSNSHHGVALETVTGDLVNTSDIGDTNIEQMLLNPTQAFDGGIGEVVIASGTITAQQITEMSDYLKNKWDTP